MTHMKTHMRIYETRPAPPHAYVPSCHANTKPQVASLGDSGLRVVRGGRVVGATKVQEHAFNMPYQLACPDILHDTDTAADAQGYSVRERGGG